MHFFPFPYGGSHRSPQKHFAAFAKTSSCLWRTSSIKAGSFSNAWMRFASDSLIAFPLSFYCKRTDMVKISVVIIPKSSDLFPAELRWRMNQPHHRSLRSCVPQKNVLRFSNLARGEFFLLKGREHFLRDSALNSSGRWWGFNADSVLPNYFSGDLDLAKPRLNFPPAGGVWGGMRAGFAFGFFRRRAMEKIIKKA